MNDPIDISHLEQYVFGDRALLDEILTIFIEQAQSLSARLCADADDEAWKLAAHTLKGASRGVGAFRLGDLAEKAEGMVGPAAAAREAHLKDLRAAASKAVEFAQKYRDDPRRPDHS